MRTRVYQLLLIAVLAGGCGESSTSVLSDISFSSPFIVISATDGTRGCELVADNASVWGVLHDESGVSVQDYVATMKELNSTEAYVFSDSSFSILERYCTFPLIAVDSVAETGRREFVQHFFSGGGLFSNPELDLDLTEEEFSRVAYHMYQYGYVLRTEGIGAVTTAYKVPDL